MLNYNTPLTAEESAFAAEHHHLLLSYLKKARLDFDEFYDIAVFGYLRAVRKYLARPELRAYQFSTIAFRAMSCDVHHSREYWLRGKRCGRIVQTLNDDQNADDLRDSVTESVDMEQYMMAQKAAYFGDYRTHARILSACTPGGLQSLGTHGIRLSGGELAPGP